MTIPKKIWTFWNTDILPVVVDNCIKTWRFFNPDYEIIILNSKNIQIWLPGLNLVDMQMNDSFARLSDMIRLNILSKYGGVWLDASIICIQSLDDWIGNILAKKPNTEFIGFYIELFTKIKKYPVIESWAFACKKGSKFVKAWRDDFMSINKHESVYDYLDHKEDEGVDFQYIDKYDDSAYLAIHIAAQKVLQIDNYPMKNMVLFKAEDGPLKYRLKNKGKLSVEKRVARLCKDYVFWSSNPFIKFTGEDRATLDKKRKLRECVFNNFKIKIMTELTGIE